MTVTEHYAGDAPADPRCPSCGWGVFAHVCPVQPKENESSDEWVSRYSEVGVVSATVGSHHDIEARGDDYPDDGGPLPIESGGWWTPYVETSWGYFRFAVRPVEQPDGLILFWHDAEGAHSQNVILDTSGDSEVRLAALREVAAALAHEQCAGSHKGYCTGVLVSHDRITAVITGLRQKGKTR